MKIHAVPDHLTFTFWRSEIKASFCISANFTSLSVSGMVTVLGGGVVAGDKVGGSTSNSLRIQNAGVRASQLTHKVIGGTLPF